MQWSGLPAAYRNRTVDHKVSTIDIAPTVYAVTGVEPPFPLSGKSMLPLLTTSAETGLIPPDEDYLLFGMDRHGSNGSPPFRAIRQGDHLVWRSWYREHDGLTPSLSNTPPGYAPNGRPEQVEWGFAMYDLSTDPYCLTNVKDLNLSLANAMWDTLEKDLVRQRDPRMFGFGAALLSEPEYTSAPPAQAITVAAKPSMLSYTDALLKEDRDQDGYEDGVSILLGAGPDRSGVNQNNTPKPKLFKQGSDFVVQYHRTPFHLHLKLVIEYTFDNQNWSREQVTDPVVIGHQDGLQVVQQRFPGKGAITAGIRFTSERRED